MYEVKIKIDVADVPDVEELLELFRKLEMDSDGTDVTHLTITKTKEISDE